MVQFTSAHIQPQWRFSKRQASHGRVAAAPLARQSVCKGRSLILLLYTMSIVERISKRVPSCSTAHIREHIFRAVSKGLECRCWRTCPSHDLTVFLGYGRTLIPLTRLSTIYYVQSLVSILFWGFSNLSGGGIPGIQKSQIQTCFLFPVLEQKFELKGCLHLTKKLHHNINANYDHLLNLVYFQRQILLFCLLNSSALIREYCDERWHMLLGGCSAPSSQGLPRCG